MSQINNPPGPQSRENAYGSNVIHRSVVPNESAGWSNQDLFAGLGDPRNAIDSDEQQREQVYLLENMVKGAMLEAAEIAKRFNVGIAVRGTNVRSHMGIESGDPTKAQEFKNKTANEKDLLLCDQMTMQDLGTVVHFNPRAGWTPPLIQSTVKPAPPTEQDWIMKELDIKQRLNSIASNPMKKGVYIPSLPHEWGGIKNRFMQRGKEYSDEHTSYVRGGKYGDHASIEGIHVRLNVQGGGTRVMVGDHDLFGFTDPATDCFLPAGGTHENTINLVQDALQSGNSFQAQHGGIWYWNPEHEKDKSIREIIMGAHGPADDEPLIYFRGKTARPVSAAFYVKGEDATEKVASVWAFNTNKKWYPY